MKTLLKFVAIIFLFLYLLNYYSYLETVMYLQGIMIFLILACLFVLAYIMIQNLNKTSQHLDK